MLCLGAFFCHVKEEYTVWTIKKMVSENQIKLFNKAIACFFFFQCPDSSNIVCQINKVHAALDEWAEGQGAVAQISVHLHKDNQAPRPTASQYR